MNKIKIAIIGVGNCASSLIQGLTYYKDVDENSGFVPGILHSVIGGYKIRDIECVAAFDVNVTKVGKDLSEAIFAFPNCAEKFCDVPRIGVTVMKGPIMDGLGNNLKELITTDPGQKDVDVAAVLRETKAEILINYLPTGSQKATEYYANQALNAGCAFINAIPVFIASKKQWDNKFREANLPIAGDDIKSQIGGTILHRAIVDLITKRGGKIDNNSQINLGGNTDFLNLSEKSRIQDKLISKTEAVSTLIPYDGHTQVPEPLYNHSHQDTRLCYINVEGRNFGNCHFSIDLKLTVEDSPNSAGVMIDLIRAMKIAIDKGISGSVNEICSFCFKHPPKQINDNEAYNIMNDFINR
ncbi:MAG: inositol-3-phosphate synthase [Tissierellia bacterium]|nr:inositol-3-phosphate synthase [Tissierellia bacterium]